VQSLLDKASMLKKRQIESAGFVAFFYALIFGVEGVGLYLRRHWAEYMVLISTGSLLPIEFYELAIHVTWLKIFIVVGNLAILLYLAHRLWLDAHAKETRRARAEARKESKASADKAKQKANKDSGSDAG
jgi:uncharacterized membrane protein (DUF2068 family)